MAVCLARALIAAHSRADGLQTQVVVRAGYGTVVECKQRLHACSVQLSCPGCLLVDASGEMAGYDEGLRAIRLGCVGERMSCRHEAGCEERYDDDSSLIVEQRLFLEQR